MGYISDIRKKVGNDAIFMPSAGGCFYKEGKILLQKRKDDGTWAFHGGCLELGETFYEALVRELKEELNVDVKKATPIGVLSGKSEHHIYPNGDEIFGLDAIFLIEEYDGEPTPDNDEVSEVKWFSLDELPDNMHYPDLYFVDVIKTYINNQELTIK